MELYNKEKWTLHSACLDVDPDTFFPPEGMSEQAQRKYEQVAKEICRFCPVAIQCLEYSLINNEMYGVWGGIGESDRRRLRNPLSTTL